MNKNVVFDEERKQFGLTDESGGGSTLQADGTTILDNNGVLSVSNPFTPQDKNSINNKVDKIEGSSLVPNTEIEKLSTLENFDDSGILTSLGNKVDKVNGFGLSQNNFTNDEKEKLSTMESSHFRGRYNSVSELEAVNGNSGDYARVIHNNTVDPFIWDSVNDTWIPEVGEGTEETPATIKEKYESNPDTNCLTDELESELIVGYEHTLKKDNPHQVTKTQVGLQYAENTLDRYKNVRSLIALGTQVSETDLERVFKPFVLSESDQMGFGEKAVGYSVSNGEFTVVYVTTITGETYNRTRVGNGWLNNWVKVNDNAVIKGSVVIAGTSSLVEIPIFDFAKLTFERITSLYTRVNVVFTKTVNLVYNYNFQRAGVVRVKYEKGGVINQGTDTRLEGDYYYDGRDFFTIRFVYEGNWYTCEVLGDSVNLNYKLVKE